MITTLIFDWDGTIHDTAAVFGIVMRAACAELADEGYMPPREYTDADFTRFLGMNAPDTWAELAPDLPHDRMVRTSDAVGAGMVRAISEGKGRLFPGVPETMDALKAAGYESVILSNCVHSYMQAIRDYWHLDRWFSGFYACEDFGFAPKEEIFQTIRTQHPGDYAVIGDRDSDMRTALVHGLTPVFCTYGFGAPGECPADALAANRFADLPGLLAGR